MFVTEWGDRRKKRDEGHFLRIKIIEALSAFAGEHYSRPPLTRIAYYSSDSEMKQEARDF